MLSYSASLITEHSTVARSHFKEVFGGLLGGSQASDNWHTAAGGYVHSAGMYGSVTGRSANGLIIDDVHKGVEDSSSPTQREKCWQTFTSCAETRLTPDGWIALIGTRWNEDDLQGRLLANESDKWTVLNFPALAELDDPLGREYGAPLWPERYSLEWYEDKKRTLEARGLGHLWNAIYGCSPTGDSSLRAFNDASYFGDHIWSDAPSEGLRVLALDPSKSKSGRTGDFNAFADATWHENGHVHFRMHLNRQPLPATYEQAIAIVRQAENEGNPFQAMCVETNMMQEAVAIAIREKLPNLPVFDRHTSSQMSKNARIITGLGPMLAQKRLHYVGRTPSNRMTIEQLKQVPNGVHDDGGDACEMACELILHILTGKKKLQPPKVLRV